ncbi:flagellar filament capping protein FliD [Paenibacillus polymyxa]|uniref:flagellar filament capping protein FliD n=1 Tax=Paenibacillus polymyxa TaxID=1406 RepID=UPI0025B69BA2|nr:flagellar filament capping protein FliD [Paenibacillus polymyxa]MDN4081865.1 flagellar filament capping protein FliD [Paenibacillus polymyxa]MDN4088903.1 flagellar filament capping protein FliD [Paenibacillus polymyxa]MDN4109280.1 flagellar filament capping protein FliD [Paenibacillus polymyxa]
MVTRISGLASGMDIDAVVKKLMTAERVPLDKLTQQKQLMEWKRESYRESSTKIVSFLQDKLTTLSRTASMNPQKVTVTGNSDALTASASSSASGVLDISVTNLATAARSVSDSSWSEKASTELAFADGAARTVQVGGDTIDVDANETIESFVKKINDNSKTGVTALYDPKSGLSLTSKTTGSQTFNIDSQISSEFKLSLTNGTDAVLKVNGLEVKKSSNNFTINGIDITLKTAGGAATRIEATKDTDKIVENIQSFVDAYNDVLATLNGKVGEERYKKYAPLTTEQKAAMSDDEVKLWTTKAKSGMLRNDPILQDTLSEMRSAMIQGVDIGRVDANGKNKPLMMSELGITTGTYDTKGKLILDADKLRAAVEKDPDVISNFFGKQDPSTALTNKYTQQDGILAKLKKISNTSLQRMADTAGTSKVSKDLTASFITTSTMGEQLSSLDRRISDMTSRLTMIETNYYKKFTAMETAISKYNSTSSSLTGMSS